MTFLWLDEFDAFYHYETAAGVVMELNEQRNFQSILTTHNTYLMQNKLTRPDCCFLITNDYIKSLESICRDGYLAIEKFIDIPEDFCCKTESSAPYPTDPAPFNHPTKIAVLRVQKSAAANEKFNITQY